MGVATTVMAITMTSMLGASAHADDALLEAQSRIARDAAANGHCDVVTQIAAEVAQTDHAFYTSQFLADPTLGYCLGVPGAKPPPPKLVPPVVATTQQLEGTPPLDAHQVAGEVMLGGTAAGIGGLVGLVVGFGLAHGCDSSDCGAVFLGGALVGVTAGASLGVYAVGSQDGQHGSYIATLGAAAVGTLGGVGIATHVDNRALGFVAIVAIPAVTSTLLFNLTRRYDVVPMPTSHGVAIAGTF